MPDAVPGHAPMAFTLNGRAVTVAAPAFAPLSDTLRERLRLTGTKVGCEAGDCGACTVLLDGAQACACLVPTAQAEGARITTIESEDGAIPALRDAFLARGAAQCGICTPAMILAAADLLARDPAPDAAAVEDAIGGVLCRCTGYRAIIAAVLDAAGAAPLLPDKAGPSDGAWAGASRDRFVAAGAVPAGRAVGARIPRLDGAAKVGGTDLFGADAPPPDALWARAVRSPHARATFALGDLDAARRHHGLVAILSARDVPGHNGYGIMPDLKDQPVLAEGHVRHRGEPVLLLVGDRAAVEAVRDADLPITWRPEAPVTGPEAALAPGAPVLHERFPDNVLARGHLRRGDVDAAHATAAATAEGHFTTAFVEHAYIEPEAGHAVPLGARMEVTACTQAPTMDREEVARVLGVPDADVRIVATACGGGFGGKLDVSVQPLLAVAARVTNRPVRMTYTRTESMAATTKRHPATIRARLSADADGRFVAYDMDGDFDTGAYASWGPTVANRVPVHAAGPYRVPNVLNRTRAVFTNAPPSGAFRGFGVPQAAIATECLVDDLAEALGMDRWAIRRLNAIGHGDATHSGQVLHASAGLADCLDALRPDWDAMLAEAARNDDPRHRLGAGIACMWYGCGNTSLSNPSTMRITLGADGGLTLWNGAADIGQGSTTVLGQIAADAVGLPVAALRQVVGDTDRTPDAGKTSASRQTFVSGRAAFEAGVALRRRVLALANAGPDARLALDGATLRVEDGEASRTIALRDLPADADGTVLEGTGRYDPPTTPLDADGQGIPYATYGFAAQCALVRVDTRLGTTKVLRIAAAQDVGRAVNPTLVEGQIHGGIAQGLGLALMEEFIPGRTENLHDYLIPTAGDVPPITVHLIEDPEPEGPYGAKGVGEPALVPTAPAILGAIRHATGVRVTRVPVLPHRLWKAMHGAGPAVPPT